MKPLNIEALMDQEVQNLSGGELQRVAITLCLGQPADIYLIDEPSAYLDSEQRIIAAKVRAGGGVCKEVVVLGLCWKAGVAGGAGVGARRKRAARDCRQCEGGGGEGGGGEGG